MPVPWWRRPQPRIDQKLHEEVHDGIQANRDSLHELADSVFELKAIAERLQIILEEMTEEEEKGEPDA